MPFVLRHIEALEPSDFFWSREAGSAKNAYCWGSEQRSNKQVDAVLIFTSDAAESFAARPTRELDEHVRLSHRRLLHRAARVIYVRV